MSRYIQSATGTGEHCMTMSVRALPPMATTAWLERMGIAGAYLFAFFALLGTAPATIALVAMALAFFFSFKDWRPLGADPLVRASLAFGCYTAVHSGTVYLTTPVTELADAAAETGADWLKLLLFVPFAYWASRMRRPGLLLLLALLGFALGILRKIDWANFGLAFFETRFETYLPAIAFGMFTALGALGLITLREWFWERQSHGLQRWIRVVCWVALLLMMLEGIVLSYSRGTWIAFAVAALLLALLEWRARPRRFASGVAQHSAVKVPGLILAAVATALLVSQSGHITERLLSEKEVAATVVQGDWSEVPSNSIGLRVHALRFAADLWLERPLLGWGAGSTRYLLANSERPELVSGGHWLSHLHNTYAEILVQLGLVGLVLLTAIVWLLVKETVTEHRLGRVPKPLGRFLLVSLIFVLIWNLTNYRIVRHDWISFWILFTGIAFSYRIRALVRRENALSAANDRAKADFRREGC